MESQLMKAGFLSKTLKRKRWALLLGATLGISTYGFYRVYNSPLIAQKRKQLSSLSKALISTADAISDSAETIGLVSVDLKNFMQSDSDQIPKSFKQISKLACSEEFSEFVSGLACAVTVGIIHGCRSDSSRFNSDGNHRFLDGVIDRISSPAATGFASVVVGSFAKNMVLGFYQSMPELGGGRTGEVDSGINGGFAPNLVDVLCNPRCKELVGDCVQVFVSTAVTVYLEKTMHINPYEEFFAGLTNPKHQKEAKDVLVSVCSGAIETLIKTSHQVLTHPSTGSDHGTCIDQRECAKQLGLLGGETILRKLKSQNVFDNDSVQKVCSKLELPNQLRVVLGVTGRATLETLRSFVWLLIERVWEEVRTCVGIARETIVGTSVKIVRCVTTKSSVIATVFLSLGLHVLDGAWILVPA